MKNSTLDCFIDRGSVSKKFSWIGRDRYPYMRNKAWIRVTIFQRGRVTALCSIVYSLAFFFVHATPSARHKFAGGTKRNETQEGAHRALCLASRDPPDNINEPISPPFPTLFPPSFENDGERNLSFLSFLLGHSFAFNKTLFILSFVLIFFFCLAHFSSPRMTLALNNVPRAF